MNLSNIQLIEKKINAINETDAFIKKSKVQRIKFYKNNIQRVQNLSIENIENYNFKIEIINHAFNLRKLALLPKITKQVLKLEIHKFAPELNTLHFTKNRFLKVPQKTNINDALSFTIQTMNIDHLKALTK